MADKRSFTEPLFGKKPGRGGALTRPLILPEQNQSPQGERYGYVPSENQKHVFGGRCL
jgi:hypothetical protein